MARIQVEHVTKRFGRVTALKDVSLEIADGEFFAVLGPPGAGKTTLLRTIVGLERPDEGEVYADGERITDMYPGDRDISIVFQNLALYPDKTVFDNLAFPLRRRKMPKREIERRVRETASALHVEHLLARKPAKLSGGERQRVALGRAMVREPRVFLFDEPLSSLDAVLRLEMRIELKRLQRELGRTLIYVTHDQVEAMSMADRIAVLRAGGVEQIDTPEEIYHRPINRFVATVVGSPPMNFLPATVSVLDGGLQITHAALRLRSPVGRLSAEQRMRLERRSSCVLGIRPENLHVGLAGAEGIEARVYVTEPLGAETVVDLRIGDAVVKALAPPSSRFEPDQEVSVTLDPRRIHIFADDESVLLSSAGTALFEIELPRRGAQLANDGLKGREGVRS